VGKLSWQALAQCQSLLLRWQLGHSAHIQILDIGTLLMNEKVEKMWADPRFQLLADMDRLLNSSKIWGGQEWTYHPIHPAKYRPMAERVRAEMGKLYAEYGVEE
jgi:hypothetical protein